MHLQRHEHAFCGTSRRPDAIKPDVESGLDVWRELNAKFARLWPNIIEKGIPPADAKEMEGVPNKLQDLFSERPGEGS
jgi:ferredoxin